MEESSDKCIQRKDSERQIVRTIDENYVSNPKIMKIFLFVVKHLTWSQFYFRPICHNYFAEPIGIIEHHYRLATRMKIEIAS